MSSLFQPLRGPIGASPDGRRGARDRRKGCGRNLICLCNGIDEDEIREAMARGAASIEDLQATIGATAGACGGSCTPQVEALLAEGADPAPEETPCLSAGDRPADGRTGGRARNPEPEDASVTDASPEPAANPGDPLP